MSEFSHSSCPLAYSPHDCERLSLYNLTNICDEKATNSLPPRNYFSRVINKELFGEASDGLLDLPERASDNHVICIYPLFYSFPNISYSGFNASQMLT